MKIPILHKQTRSASAFSETEVVLSQLGLAALHMKLECNTFLATQATSKAQLIWELLLNLTPRFLLTCLLERNVCVRIMVKDSKKTTTKVRNEMNTSLKTSDVSVSSIL